MVSQKKIKWFGGKRNVGIYLNSIYEIRKNRINNYNNFNYINLLTPSGFSPYHHVEHSKIPHGTRFALSVCTDIRTDSDFCFIQH